jgi:hypothetical protein
MSTPSGGSERRHRFEYSRPARVQPSPGRRRSDHDPRTTVTKKVIVITVILVDALYLAGEALLFNGNVC